MGQKPDFKSSIGKKHDVYPQECYTMKYDILLKWILIKLVIQQ